MLGMCRVGRGEVGMLHVGGVLCQGVVLVLLKVLGWEIVMMMMVGRRVLLHMVVLGVLCVYLCLGLALRRPHQFPR